MISLDIIYSWEIIESLIYLSRQRLGTWERYEYWLKVHDEEERVEDIINEFYCDYLWNSIYCPEEMGGYY